MRWFNLTWILLLTACGQARKYTFDATPPDALIAIDDQPARTAGFSEKIKFKNAKDVHTATATHLDYESQSIRLTRDDLKTTINFELKAKAQGDLTVLTIALCTKVDAFGVYEPIASPSFVAGKENQVIVYTEIGGFSSTADENKIWQTNLRQEMALYTETGKPVWPEKSNAQSFADKARTHRRDFYLARVATLPANLPAGRYSLKVIITDEQANAVAEISTPIEITEK